MMATMTTTCNEYENLHSIQTYSNPTQCEPIQPNSTQSSPTQADPTNTTQPKSIQSQRKPNQSLSTGTNPTHAYQSNPHQDNTNHPNPTPHGPTQSNAFCSWPPFDPLEISASPLSAIMAPCLPRRDGFIKPERCRHGGLRGWPGAAMRSPWGALQGFWLPCRLTWDAHWYTLGRAE